MGFQGKEKKNTETGIMNEFVASEKMRNRKKILLAIRIIEP